MRLLPTSSLVLVGFVTATVFAGCGSDNVGGSTVTGGTAGNPSGGSGNPSGGSGNPSGGSGNPSGGSGNPSGGSGNPSGGSGNPSGGSSNPSGGSSNPSGGSAGSGPDVDQNGKPNAAPGSMTSTPEDYLRMGEIRLLNNNWGSADLNCNAPMSVFINQDQSFGWTFDRGNCDTQDSNQYPDFPQVEFGIHPFGIGNELATSPEFSSTTLLPLQIKDIIAPTGSASVTVTNMSIQLQNQSSWNITFEFWLSTQHPTTPGSAGVHTELMTFWGWQGGRWPSSPGADGSADGGSIGQAGGDTVSAGTKNYRLWVQRDNWASGWRYYQFRDDGGAQTSFSGTVDVKALLNYLVNTRGFSPDLWVTRLEVGSEIDDNTSGTVTIQNIAFEVNGQTRTPVFGQ